MKRYTFSAALALCLIGAGEAVASGKITKVDPQAGSIELTIQTTPGDSYQMQCRPSLVSGDWVDLETVFVANASSTIKTVDASASKCYFRVVKIMEQPIGPGGDPPPPPPPPPVPGA
ncbi:MAG: hypothetical protein K9M54_04545 [Kiritimatiellales bacterium]|nr:hypothetical protein [Kiritimatiellales bacterium]MCF7864596.1 hypothetical protein [Kiritimatiellales bacterium]